MQISNLLPVLGLDVDESCLFVLVPFLEHDRRLVQLAGSLQHGTQITIQLTVIQFEGKLDAPRKTSELKYTTSARGRTV